ncbi:MAG TPA: YeeE/YedE thiosulfate transporter family protein [Thermoanaerobaculia bacterium]|nr:YeeE/YedE thiosulfate transporter family protein [Thermoanaerobaculia bacterium]
MTFPFNVLSDNAREAGLLVAVLIGIAFGFVLERAGFGRSTKLAGQFYFRDMTVFKVMFSAIVTAMLGLVIASGFGMANLRDISEHIASWTYIWPMLAGGFVLGAGFIVSGYCPGTSIVASASGNIDGMFAFGGVVAGTFVYSELLQIPGFARFHTSGERGAWFLYDWLGIPAQLLALIVTIVAIAGFIGAEKVEALLARAAGREIVAPRKPRRLAFATLAALSVVMLATLGVPAASPAPSAHQAGAIAVADLAHAITNAPWSVRVVDFRDEAGFAKSRIPGSENAKPQMLSEIATQTATSGRRLVVVSNGPLPAIPNMRVLAGGFEGWRQYALLPPPAPRASASRSELDEYLFRASLNQMLTGQRVAAVPIPAAAPGAIAAPKKKGGGCSS